MKARIRERALQLGFDVFGAAPAVPPPHGKAFVDWLRAGRHAGMAYLERRAAERLDPDRVLPGAKSVLAVGCAYGSTEAERAEAAANEGIVARYARRLDYHKIMGKRLKELADFVQELGGPGCRARAYVDTGPILEREYAWLAGLGFIGKNTQLIHPRFGNWLLLGVVLTTLEIEPDRPLPNRCGSCRRCLDACPTGALRKPFELDATRCAAYWTIEARDGIPRELRGSFGNRLFGCDACLEACPWNRRSGPGALFGPETQWSSGRLDCAELLRLEDEAFRVRFRGTPLLRPKRRGLVRNACVALGNVGGASALASLEELANSEDETLAEHARWAAARIRDRLGAP